MSENRAYLTGFVGNDPRSGVTEAGKHWARFSVASSNDYFDKQTQQWVQREPDWIPVVCWDKVAEDVIRKIGKGDKVSIIGRNEVKKREDDRFKDAAGNPCVRYEGQIRAFSVDRCYHEKRQGGYQPTDADYPGERGAAQQPAGSSFDDCDLGDLGPPLDMDDAPYPR